MKLFGWYITRELPEPAEVRVKEFVNRTITLLGTPAPVTIYMVRDPEFRRALDLHKSHMSSYYALAAFGSAKIRPEPKPHEWHGHYFASCEQAFAAHPTAEVDAVSGWKIGDQFVTGLEVRPITIQPKPKRPKGK